MKKKIIVILLIVLICLCGVLFYLFKFTDIFKSNNQLFWKYLSKSEDFVELFDNESIERINKDRLSKSYIKTSQLQISQNDDVVAFNIDTNAWNSNNVYADVTINKNSDEVAKLKFVKKSNVVGIKMDELADGFISVKSNRLKEITKLIGIEDGDNIVPDNINVFTGFDVLELSKEDREYLLTKYGKIIQSHTDSNDYNKLDESRIKIDDKFYKVDGYKLSLSENKTKAITTDIFDELASDSKALNIISTRLKVMNIPDKYSSINSLSDRFTKIAESIDSIETTDDEYLNVTVYVNEKKLKMIDIEYSDGNKISIDYSKENNRLRIKQSNEAEGQESNSKHYMFLNTISNKVKNIVESISEATININNSDEQSEIVSNVNVILKDEKIINYKSSIKITNDVAINEDYDSSKKIVLNNLNQQQLKQIYTLIVDNVQEIYKEKLNVINTQVNNNVQTNAE